MPKDQVNPTEANELTRQIFASAKSRQVFGVDFKTLTRQEKADYVKSFYCREVWFHQAEPLDILTDPMEKRTTFNASRQVGKCLCSTSYITLANGSIKQIKDIPAYVPIELATVLDGRVTKAWGVAIPSGVKPVLEHSYFSSESIVTTAEHKFYRRKTKRRWKDSPVEYLGFDWVEAKNQQPRDHIATASNLSELSTSTDYSITDNEIKFLAYHLAEGSTSKRSKTLIQFSTASEQIAAELDSIAFSLGSCLVPQKKRSNATDFYYRRRDSGVECGAVARINKWGLAGKDCYEKFIPDFVFSFSKRQLALFLNRFLACDGYAALSKAGPEIGCTLANRLMVTQLANIFKLLGFPVRINRATRPCCYPDGSKKYFEHWTVCLSRSIAAYVKFQADVNIFTKEVAVAKCISRVLEKKSSPRHEHSLAEDLRYVFFQESLPAGEAETYDIQIIIPPKNFTPSYEPNFIANGFVVHNSEVLSWAESLCAMHNTHPALDGRTKVVGLANKFSQTQIVGNRLRALLNENYERTKFFWDREGSTRAHIVFRREAGINTNETGTIDYVTANPKAFSEGFTASLAVVDEANRLDQKVLSEVIIPYLSSTNGSLCLTGVSRGKGVFYDACNSRDYRHLHYPWDAVETYRRAAPANIHFDDGRIKEVGLYPLEVMPLSLKKAWFPSNPMVHVLPTTRQKEKWVRMWELSEGSMAEEDFRSQYGLEWLADVLAFLQLLDQQLLFDHGDFRPMERGRDDVRYCFGLDCGGSRNAYSPQTTNKDRASLSIWQRSGHIKQKVWCDEKDDVLPEQLVAWLREICHPVTGRFKCTHGTVDVTGAVGAFASQHLKNCGIPIIPIMYNRTEEITHKNFKNAMFEYFKLENSAGRTQYPAPCYVDALDDITLKPLYPTFYVHREEWEILEQRITTSVNSIISAPAGEHDDGPNSDVLCVYGMDHPNLFKEELNVKKRARRGIIGPGLANRNAGPSWGQSR